jgi:hypothetical protein
VNPETQQIEYQLATVDGKPVDETNIHKLITNGTKIEEIYISFGTTSKSPQGISTRQIVQEIVITPSAPRKTDGYQKVSNSDLVEKIAAAQRAKQKAEAAAASTSSTADGAVSDDDGGEPPSNLDSAIDDI